MTISQHTKIASALEHIAAAMFLGVILFLFLWGMA
jgi:hypothetical protein